MSRPSRKVVLVAACTGAVVGAVLVAWFLDDSRMQKRTRAARAEAANYLLQQLGSGETKAGLPAELLDSKNFADRSMLVLLAARADAGDLRVLIEEAAGIRNRSSRSFALQLLVARYAEIDPYDAIDLVYEFGLGDAFIATIYAVWADADEPSALRALQLVDDPSLARRIAMAMFDAMGAGAAAVDKLAQNLPPQLDATRFQLDVMERRAADDPHLVMSEVLSMADPAFRYRALMRIAPVWVQQDPHAALAAARSIDDKDHRWRFRAQVMTDWSREDPDSVMAYLAGINDPDRDQLNMAAYAYPTLASHDPAGLIRATANFPRDERYGAMASAFQAWLRSDSEAAVAAFDALPSDTPNRRNLLQSFAASYAAADPEAALAWAASRTSRYDGSTAMSAVISGVAGSDPGHAIALAQSLEDGRQRHQTIQQISYRAIYDGADPVSVAEALLAIPDAPANQGIMGNFVQAWGNREPEAALQWMLDNRERLGEGAFEDIGRRLAHSDPLMAASLTNRIPEEMRGDWVERVATGYSRADPDGARLWVQSLQGTPEYERALVGTAHVLAQEDPMTVINLAGSMQDPVAASAMVRNAVDSWAEQDPAAAAAWAQSQVDEQMRANSIRTVAAQWAETDRAAATAWALRLPPGAVRDDALTMVMARHRNEGMPDLSLLDELSSASAKQQAAVWLVPTVARHDRAAAQALIDDYVTDPAMRRQAERNLSRSR